MNSKKIPQGYKKTEIGLIPEDWEIKKLGNDGKFFSGGTPNTSIREYYRGRIPFITSSDLNQGVIKKVSLNISEKGLKHSSAKMIKKGQLIVALYGATAGVVAISKINGAINQAVLAIQSDSFDKKYLYYWFQNNRQYILNKYTQGGQPNLSAIIIKNFLLPLPPLSEQQAIARVLSDVDGLIESLDRLINKKKMIKKGAMQQLLTGRQRLPGFTGKWVRKKLGEIADFKNGKTLEKYITKNGKYYLITLDSLDIEGKLKKEHLRTNFNGNFLSRGDLVMILSDVAHGNFLGLTDVIPEDNKYLINQRVAALKNVKDVLPFYLSKYINIKQNYFKTMGQGSSQQNLNKKDVLNFEVFYPPTLEEQQAIAQILSDMDAEIEALEKKKEKYEMLKKGLMEQLLTGKIRLKNHIKEVLQ